MQRYSRELVCADAAVLPLRLAEDFVDDGICATLTVWPALRPFSVGRWVRGLMTWHAASRWTLQRRARDSARLTQLFMLSTSWTTEKRPIT